MPHSLEADIALRAPCGAPTKNEHLRMVTGRYPMIIRVASCFALSRRCKNSQPGPLPFGLPGLCCSFLLGCQKLSPIGVQARLLWRKISPSARLAARSQKTRTCIASCFALSQCKRSFFVSVTHARAAPAPQARLGTCPDMVTGRYHKNLQNALKLYILCS